MIPPPTPPVFPPFCLTERFPRASAQTAEPLCVATVEQNGPSKEGEKNPTGNEERKKINAREGDFKKKKKKGERGKMRAGR